MVAKTILQKSEAKHKLLFSITDGEWFVSQTGCNTIAEMNKAGVLTFLVQLPTSFKSDSSNDAQHFGKPSVIVAPNFSFIARRMMANNKQTPANYGHQYLVQSHDCVSLTNAIGKHITGAMMNP
jgi:hypothetical protein